MTLFVNAARAAILGACLLAGPVATADVREVVQVRVSRTGLNLSTPIGRAAFDTRVRRAARWACAPRNASVAADREAARCRAEMAADAEAQVAAIAPRG